MPKHALRRLALCVTLVVVWAAGAAPPACGGDEEAGYPGAFLRYGVSVRSLGMGRVYAALEDCPGLMYDNPASLMSGERALGLFAMHYEPGLSEGFNYFAGALAGTYRGPSPLGKFLFGPSAAWGISYVDVGTDDIGARDEEDQPLGESFGFYERALLVGFAREWVGPRGVLDYGATFKFLSQGFDGGAFDQSDGGFGLDLGAQVQLINPPLWPLSKLSIKRCLPLRLGFVVQNVVNPQLTSGDTDDTVPTVLRLGMSYGFENLLAEGTRLLVAGDVDWLFDDFGDLTRWDRGNNRGWGRYLGVENQLSLGQLRLATPRLGVNNEGEGSSWAAGFGLCYPIAGANLRLDYAHKFIGEIGDNDHISLTFSTLARRDAEYFRGAASWLGERDSRLRFLGEMPARQDANSAAMELAETHDTPRRARYNDFIGGATSARALYAEMIRALQEEDESAFDLARKVADAYVKASSDESTKLQGVDHLYHAEALLVIGMDDGSRYGEAIAVLTEAEGGGSVDALVVNYERGVACLGQGDFSQAALAFTKAATADHENTRQMRLLSRYGAAQAQLGASQYEAARSALTLLEHEGELPLGEEYPRYHPTELGALGVERRGLVGAPGRLNAFPDRQLADDVLLIQAVCSSSAAPGNPVLSATYLHRLCRFFPDSDVRSTATSTLRSMLERETIQ